MKTPELNAHPPTPRPKGNRLFKWAWRLLALLLGAGLVLAILAQALKLSVNTIVNVQHALVQFKLAGLAVQFALAAAAIWRWPKLIDWAIARSIIGEDQRQRALRARLRVAALLLIIILVEAGPSGVKAAYLDALALIGQG